MTQKVTESIKKAMVLNHGVTYADYVNNLEKRIRVEIDREANHRKAMEIVATFTSFRKGA